MKIKNIFWMSLFTASLLILNANAAPVDSKKAVQEEGGLQIEGNVKYPMVLGSAAQGFTPAIGFGASVYFSPMFDPGIHNFVSVGYHAYKLKADGGMSALRIIPVMFGIELPGKVFTDLKSTFALAAGIAPNYIHVPTISSFNWSIAFAVQFKPGLEYAASENFSIVAHMPLSIFISRATLNSIDFDAGLKFKL